MVSATRLAIDKLYKTVVRIQNDVKQWGWYTRRELLY